MKIAVGLSGGIDSSVTAYILKKAGHEVIGLTMQIWDGSVPLRDEGLSACYGPGEPRDIEAASTHAARLGIPHHIIPLSGEFKTGVLDYFRNEYLAGRTPNPCVKCNATLKFGLMLRRAKESGIQFERFATGHYARLSEDAATGRQLLLKGVDPAKDQSYFLSRLNQQQLASAMFPLGGMTKTQVKAIAAECGWTDMLDKPESQNFIESKHYDALFEKSQLTPGPILDTQGKKIGEHKGIVHHTIGQRKGLGLGGAGEPLYVISVNACSNSIVVGPKAELLSSELTASQLNWIALKAPPAEPFQIKARIRQQHREAPATVTVTQTVDRTTARVVFAEPQMSVTPGQIVVFYDGDSVAGSGIIDFS